MRSLSCRKLVAVAWFAPFLSFWADPCSCVVARNVFLLDAIPKNTPLCRCQLWACRTLAHLRSLLPRVQGFAQYQGSEWDVTYLSWIAVQNRGSLGWSGDRGDKGLGSVWSCFPRWGNPAGGVRVSRGIGQHPRVDAVTVARVWLETGLMGERLV